MPGLATDASVVPHPPPCLDRRRTPPPCPEIPHGGPSRVLAAFAASVLAAIAASVLGRGLQPAGESRGGGMGSIARLAKRAVETDAPVMVKIQELLRGATNVMSLAQGVVYWQPPESSMNKVEKIIREPAVSKYGSDDGLPELREALLEKLRRENKLTKSSVMVTAGANQMTGVTDILVGACDSKTLHPDVDWLERDLKQDPVPKLVTVVNPGNPSRAFIPRPMLERISDLCKNAGAWLVVENTYEVYVSLKVAHEKLGIKELGPQLMD